MEILAADAGRLGDRKLGALGAEVERLGAGEEGRDEDVVILAEGELVAGGRDLIFDDQLALRVVRRSLPFMSTLISFSF